jgi:tetratricopeptide (TPR) repeat protein
MQGSDLAATLSLTAAVDAAARLLATAPAQAERQALAILKAAPGDPRAALILGSARRRRGDAQGALAVLEPLAGAHPRAANTYYELGVTLAALGRNAAAIIALRHAVGVKRDLPEAWRALGDLLFTFGDVAGAETAFAEHARACVQDQRLKPAAEALFAGDMPAVERLLRPHLASLPNDATALHMLAQARARQGGHSDAETLLARCLELDPSFDGARFSYANALFDQQKAAQAIAQVEILMQRDANHPAYRNLLAAGLALVGDYARVNAIYDGLLAQYPNQPRIWLNAAHALRTVGRRDEAVAAYRRCIALAPELGDAYWGLANLKTASLTDAEAKAMAAQLQRADLPGEDRLHLNFALGKALEDRGDYADAFAHYAAGAKIRRASIPYDADETTAQMQRAKAVFTSAFFADRQGFGSPSSAPIFVLGLPRSGSTLIEQILASHSAVEGTMELPDIGFLAKSLDRAARGGRGPSYPERLVELDAASASALGESYIATTAIQRQLDRPRFIDKMPNNFQYIGLIHLILPNAKIIDARRHPLGSCFSAFKQHFAQGQAFSYDLTDLGRYYADYVELMTHVDTAIPARIHRVIYEDLVEDTDAQVRRLLDYCGLPFEEGCLKFYDNDRAVRTVSSEQVRQPIFRDGLEQWRRFEPWLGPLKTALGPALETWRGDAA